MLISALNDDLDQVSVRYAALVFRDSFLKSAEAGRMGLPAVPLSRAIRRRDSYIEARGGHVHLRASVDSIEAFGDGVQISVGGETIASRLRDPRHAVQRRSRSCCPTRLRCSRCASRLHIFGSVPITGIHLWFDREITPLEHAVLLERTIQWMFQKSKILNTRRDYRRNR